MGGRTGSADRHSSREPKYKPNVVTPKPEVQQARKAFQEALREKQAFWAEELAQWSEEFGDRAIKQLRELVKE